MVLGRLSVCKLAVFPRWRVDCLELRIYSTTEMTGIGLPGASLTHNRLSNLRQSLNLTFDVIIKNNTMLMLATKQSEKQSCFA